MVFTKKEIFVILVLIFNCIFFREALCSEAEKSAGFLRNPFLTALEQKTGIVKDNKKEITYPLYLQAVFIWPNKKVALINGCILKEGEFIEGKELVSIMQDKVLLKDKSQATIMLTLPLVSKTKESEK